jgi:uncharacterized YccA/Bax inhibitor family protein
MANPALSRNPAFGRPTATSAAQLEELFNRPSAHPGDIGRMTYQDTAVKTVVLFAVLLATAAIGWFVPVLAIVGAIGGLVFGLINAFKRSPSVPLIVLYAAFEGLFVGGISSIFDAMWNGVVLQAVLATMVTFVITLALFASGRIRASARATKIFLIAMVGYFAFSIINVLLISFGAIKSPYQGGQTIQLMGFSLNLGIVIGVIAVLLAAYSLVLDFDMIQRGVRNGAPARFGWYAAYGLMVTLVWLYLEFLRIFGLARSN